MHCEWNLKLRSHNASCCLTEVVTKAVLTVLWICLISCISIFVVWVKHLCSWICNSVVLLLWSVHLLWQIFVEFWFSGLMLSTKSMSSQYCKTLTYNYFTDITVVTCWILTYITDLVCYTNFHWFFNHECQHIFGKQTGYIFQPSKKTIE